MYEIKPVVPAHAMAARLATFMRAVDQDPTPLLQCCRLLTDGSTHTAVSVGAQAQVAVVGEWPNRGVPRSALLERTCDPVMRANMLTLMQQPTGQRFVEFSSGRRGVGMTFHLFRTRSLLLELQLIASMSHMLEHTITRFLDLAERLACVHRSVGISVSWRPPTDYTWSLHVPVATEATPGTSLQCVDEVAAELDVDTDARALVRELHPVLGIDAPTMVTLTASPTVVLPELSLTYSQCPLDIVVGCACSLSGDDSGPLLGKIAGVFDLDVAAGFEVTMRRDEQLDWRVAVGR